MTIPQPLFWALFTVAMIWVICGFAWMFLRSEPLGTIECPCEVRGTQLDCKLTLAREGGGTPTAQLRVRIPMFFCIHRLPAAEARDLAELLDKAAGGDQETRTLGQQEVGRAFEQGRQWVRLAIHDKSDNGPVEINAWLTPSQARLMAQWLRTAATPGRTVADARRRSSKAPA